MKKEDEKKILYTIKEVAELSGISEQEIIRLIMLRKIKALRLGSAIRISEKDYHDFLNYMTVASDEVFETSSEPVLYTAEEVAKILKLTVDNVWLLLKTGRLKGFKLREGRSSWRITSKNIHDFIESRSNTNAGK